MMHANAANRTAPICGFEHALNSNLMSDLSLWFGSNPSVPSACTDGSGMQTAEGCTKNGMDDFEKIRFWTTPVSSCEPGRSACPTTAGSPTISA